ncbi:hypothetical protein HDU96_000638 [Phlyctochytrium bullatum]|nr:hypothetical protein HDU96_000638 [Phlyctochytrium bullatum]
MRLRVPIFVEAFEMELCDLDGIKSRVEIDPWTCYDNTHFSEPVDAFIIAALGDSVDMLNDLIEEYWADTFKEREFLLKTFEVAAIHESITMTELVFWVLELKEVNLSPVLEAFIRHGFAEGLKWLIAKHGSEILDTRIGRQTLLQYAVFCGRPEMLDLLLKKGATLTTSPLFDEELG